MRGERGERALEAHLIVALAGAAVAERIAILGDGGIDLRSRDDGPGDRCAEEIAPLIDRTGDRHGIGELFEEGLAEILDHALRRTRAERLRLDPLEFTGALADIGDDRNDFAAVGLDEPGNDAGGVEPSGVGERNATGLVWSGHSGPLVLLGCCLVVRGGQRDPCSELLARADWAMSGRSKATSRAFWRCIRFSA